MTYRTPCLFIYEVQILHLLLGKTFTVYKNNLEVVRCSTVVTPGLEALHVSIGARDGIGILLGYCTLHDPAISLPELADFISAAVLESPRFLVLGDFNVHAEADVSGLALSSWRPWLPWTCPNMSVTLATWVTTH